MAIGMKSKRMKALEDGKDVNLKLENHVAQSMKAGRNEGFSNVLKTNKCELDEKQVMVAVKAAFQAFRTTRKESSMKELFHDDDLPINLLISAIKIPCGDPKPLKFRMPHPFWNSDSEICLIVKDLKKGWKVDHEPTVEFFKGLLQEHNVSFINEIVPLRQLRVENKPFEARGKLAKRFDVIFVDRRIAKFVPRYLGKAFYQTGKLPISVNIDADDLSKEITGALGLSTMSMTKHGTSSQVQVGLSSQSEEAVCENILAAYKTLLKNFPGSFANVRSLTIRFGTCSWTVPVYVSYAARNFIASLPADSRRVKPLVDDLSTLTPGWKVVVHPNGKVQKIRDRQYVKTAMDLADVADRPDCKRKRTRIDLDLDDGKYDSESGDEESEELEVQAHREANGPLKVGVIDSGDSELANTAVDSRFTIRNDANGDSSEDEGDALEEEYMNELEMLEEKDTVAHSDNVYEPEKVQEHTKDSSRKRELKKIRKIISN